MNKAERDQFMQMLPRLEKNLSSRLNDYEEVLDTYWMLIEEHGCEDLQTDDHMDISLQMNELCRDVRILLRKILLLEDFSVTDESSRDKLERMMSDIARTHQAYQTKWDEVHMRFGDLLHAVKDACHNEFGADSAQDLL